MSQLDKRNNFLRINRKRLKNFRDKKGKERLQKEDNKSRIYIGIISPTNIFYYSMGIKTKLA